MMGSTNVDKEGTCSHFGFSSTNGEMSKKHELQIEVQSDGTIQEGMSSSLTYKSV